MRILFLETPYSPLFRQLGKELKPQASFSHVFQLGSLLYLPWKKLYFAAVESRDQHFSKADLELVKESKSLLNSNVRKPTFLELLEMAKYAAYLRQFLIQHKVSHCFCYNDLRWQHAVAKRICTEFGVKTIFFEEGYFRPNTITVDSEGINANALESVRKSLATACASQASEPFLKPNFVQRWKTNFVFGLYLIANRCGDILNLNVFPKNKRYSIRSYLRILFRRSIGNYTELPSRFIFVPLQVDNDTQTVLHSSFRSTQEVIDTVEQAFYDLDARERNGCSLVFKAHPMAARQAYKFHRQSHVSRVNTQQLVSKATFMVTVNSTVTIDALKANKRILLLGKSIFGLAGTAKEVSRHQLKNEIQSLLNSSRVDEAEMNRNRNFLTALRANYQVEGNFYNYRPRLRTLVDRITQL